MAWFGGGGGGGFGNMMGGLGDRLQAGGRALGGGQGMAAGNPYTGGMGGAYGRGGGGMGGGYGGGGYGGGFSPAELAHIGGQAGQGYGGIARGLMGQSGMMPGGGGYLGPPVTGGPGTGRPLPWGNKTMPVQRPAPIQAPGGPTMYTAGTPGFDERTGMRRRGF